MRNCLRARGQIVGSLIAVLSLTFVAGPAHALDAWTSPSWGFLPTDAKFKKVTRTLPTRPLATTGENASNSTDAAADILNSIVPTVRPVAKSQAPHIPLAYSQPQGLSPRVLVIDEESLMLNDPQPISGAEVHWVAADSGVSLRTGADGVAVAPYPNTVSARFVVTLPGYLPAVGYVTAGVTTPVVLFRESRIGPILKSLDVVPDADRTLVLGKILRADLTPAAGLTIDASVDAPFRTFYSIGSFGLYHPAATETGSQGDFLVSGLRHGLQYLMPSENSRDWPAWIIDTNELPAFVTTTLVESAVTETQTQVVDALSLERPETGIHVTVGGQRGLYLPDNDGSLKFTDLHPRGSAELLEVNAQGYLKGWVSTVANAKLFPGVISLFTRLQLESIFENLRSVDLDKGIVFGNLRSERFTRPVTVSVFGPLGRQNGDAQVLYFDADNRVAPNADSTDPVLQNFAVVNLDPGEWHLILNDPIGEKGIGVQTVRVENGTISQVQF